MRTCSRCGRPIRESNQVGICRETPDCAKANNRAHYEARKPEQAECIVCGGPVRADSKFRICKRKPECRCKRSAIYYADNKEDLLARQAQWYKNNAERLRPKQAKYRRDNPDKIRDTRRRQYGLEPGDYEAMLAAQEGKCAGCSRDDIPLYIDHDHSCCPKLPTCGKCNRGLLCEKCNRGIGFLQDDPVTLRSLANYLERSKTDG